MDLKQYFRKLREVEAAINEPYPLVCSLETSDGGKPGVISEVPREVAAKMIVEGRATLATGAEKQRYHEDQAAAKAAAEKAEMAKRVQVAILAEPPRPAGSQDKNPAIKR